MKRWLLVITLLLTPVLRVEAGGGAFLKGSGTGGGSGNIIDIQPHSATILDNVNANVNFTCVMDNGSACPPAGYVWSFGNQPPFASIDRNTGVATFTAPMADCTPAQDNCTFSVTIGPPPPVVVSGITPTTINIPSDTPINTQFQLMCQKNDNSQCQTGVTWSFSGLPSFLTSGTNATGGYVQTTQSPPLTVSTGTFSATAQ